MSEAQRKMIGRLLVEASGNDPRKLADGSVRFYPDGVIDWTERTKRGLVARTGLVHHLTLWNLMADALAPPTDPSGGRA